MIIYDRSVDNPDYIDLRRTHYSVKEYLIRPGTPFYAGTIYSLDPKVAAYDMMKTCLTYILTVPPKAFSKTPSRPDFPFTYLALIYIEKCYVKLTEEGKNDWSDTEVEDLLIKYLMEWLPTSVAGVVGSTALSALKNIMARSQTHSLSYSWYPNGSAFLSRAVYSTKAYLKDVLWLCCLDSKKFSKGNETDDAL
jgi:hypothetical protein